MGTCQEAQFVIVISCLVVKLVFVFKRFKICVGQGVTYDVCGCVVCVCARVCGVCVCVAVDGHHSEGAGMCAVLMQDKVGSTDCNCMKYISCLASFSCF